MEQKEQSKVEYWRQIIVKAEASSLSINEWCRQNGIKSRKFYYWRKRLREIAQPPEGASSVHSDNNQFIEFSIEDEPLPEPHANPLRNASPIPESFMLSSVIEPEVRIETSYFKVFVKSGVKEQTLRMVLKVIGDA